MPCSQVTSANAFFYVLYFFCFNGFCFISRLVILCVILFHSTFLRFYASIFRFIYCFNFFRISSPRSYTFLLRFAFLIPRPSLVFSRFAASFSLSFSTYSVLYLRCSPFPTPLYPGLLCISPFLLIFFALYTAPLYYALSSSVLLLGRHPTLWSSSRPVLGACCAAPPFLASACFVLRRFALFYFPLFRFALSRVRTRGFGEIRAGLTALCNLLAARRERERERARKREPRAQAAPLILRNAF